MNRPVLAVLLTLAPMAAAHGEEVLGRYSWEGHGDRLAGVGGKALAPGDGGEFWRLRVERAEPGPPASLLVLDSPPITADTYAVRGRVRYEAVEGDGFLEMWSTFPDGGRFFSRTLAPNGPLATLSGSAGWRQFVLPFTSSPEHPAPVRLEVNLVLPARGAVELGPLELVQFSPGEDPLATPGQWWTARQAGLVGALLGLVLGGLGAWGGVMGARGRAPSRVVALLWAVGATGLGLLGAAVVAEILSQPWEVYYPLALAGAIAALLAAALLPVARRRRAEIELQRMRAHDLD